MSVNSGVPVPFGLLYRLKVTVPVGLYPPLTVAWSAIEVPTVARGRLLAGVDRRGRRRVGQAEAGRGRDAGGRGHHGVAAGGRVGRGRDGGLAAG